MRSTEFPEGSSVGRFVLDCGTPYSRSPWNDRTGENDWTLQVDWWRGKAFCFHGEKLRAPEFPRVEGDDIDFVLRFVCHLLVDRIDKTGLPEVCQSLAEFYKYYQPAEDSTRLLCESRRIDASVRERSTSPPFAIGEE
jgi:hypothetical protein